MILGIYNRNDGNFIQYGEDSRVSYDNKQLTLTNSKYGQHPLFILRYDNYVIFSDEYPELLRYDKELNLSAIAEFFLVGSTLGDVTFFKNITNLPMGTTVIFNTDGERSVEHKEHIGINEKPISYFTKRFAELFKRIIPDMAKDVDYIGITGGLDTRLILANLPKDIDKHFFVCGHPDIDDSGNPDILISKMLVPDRIIFPTPEIVYPERKMRNYILSGLCGGEFFGGKVFDHPSPVKNPGFEDHFYKFKDNDIFRLTYKNPTLKLYSELYNGYGDPELYFLLKQSSRSFFYDYGDYRWRQPVCKVHNGITPFKHEEFLDLLLTVPPRFLKHRRLQCEIYREYYPELARIPNTSIKIYDDVPIWEYPSPIWKTDECKEISAVSREIFSTQFLKNRTSKLASFERWLKLVDI